MQQRKGLASRLKSLRSCCCGDNLAATSLTFYIQRLHCRNASRLRWANWIYTAASETVVQRSVMISNTCEYRTEVTGCATGKTEGLKITMVLNLWPRMASEAIHLRMSKVLTLFPSKQSFPPVTLAIDNILSHVLACSYSCGHIMLCLRSLFVLLFKRG